MKKQYVLQIIFICSMLSFFVGCSTTSHTLEQVTIQVRDQITGEPVPYAKVNVYATDDAGSTPPRGSITSTNTNGVATVVASNDYPTFFEIYIQDHYMIPLHYDQVVERGYLEGWRKCGISMLNGRPIEMRVVSVNEAFALKQLPERSLNLPPSVIVIEPEPIADPVDDPQMRPADQNTTIPGNAQDVEFTTTEGHSPTTNNAATTNPTSTSPANVTTQGSTTTQSNTSTQSATTTQGHSTTQDTTTSTNDNISPDPVDTIEQDTPNHDAPQDPRDGRVQFDDQPSGNQNRRDESDIQDAGDVEWTTG